MNDVFQLWSLPWHALQHSLANGFPAAATRAAVAAPSLPRQQLPAHGAAGAGYSWLARALAGRHPA